MSCTFVKQSLFRDISTILTTFVFSGDQRYQQERVVGSEEVLQGGQVYSSAAGASDEALL